MKRLVLVAIVVFGLSLLVGCTSIEDMIEEATQQDITVSRTVHNSDSERGIQSATVMEAATISSGHYHTPGVVKIDTLSERIDVSRLGLAEVRFFLKAHIRNESNWPAVVTFYAIANQDPDGDPIAIGSLSMSPNETVKIENAGELDQDALTVHANLASVFDQLDENYEIIPAVLVQGPASANVTVNWVQVAAMPVYLRSEAFSTGSMRSYKNNITDIHKCQLAGSVTNTGDEFADVKLYLTAGADEETVETLVAKRFLGPGEEITGKDMTIEGGNDEIKSAFKRIIAGDDSGFDYVVVSDQPLSVKGNNLRIQCKLTVEADIF